MLSYITRKGLVTWGRAAGVSHLLIIHHHGPLLSSACTDGIMFSSIMATLRKRSGDMRKSNWHITSTNYTSSWVSLNLWIHWSHYVFIYHRCTKRKVWWCEKEQQTYHNLLLIPNLAPKSRLHSYVCSSSDPHLLLTLVLVLTLVLTWEWWSSTSE